MTPSFRFPLQAGGTEGAWFPSRCGGNPQEGGVNPSRNPVNLHESRSSGTIEMCGASARTKMEANEQ